MGTLREISISNYCWIQDGQFFCENSPRWLQCWENCKIVKGVCSICVSGIYELGMFGYVWGMLRVRSCAWQRDLWVEHQPTKGSGSSWEKSLEWSDPKLSALEMIWFSAYNSICAPWINCCMIDVNVISGFQLVNCILVDWCGAPLSFPLQTFRDPGCFMSWASPEVRAAQGRPLFWECSAALWALFTPTLKPESYTHSST
jgi:hypothetical protein